MKKVLQVIHSPHRSKGSKGSIMSSAASTTSSALQSVHASTTSGKSTVSVNSTTSIRPRRADGYQGDFIVDTVDVQASAWPGMAGGRRGDPTPSPARRGFNVGSPAASGDDPGPEVPSPLLPELPTHHHRGQPSALSNRANYWSHDGNNVPTKPNCIEYPNKDKYEGGVVNGLPQDEGVYTSSADNLTRRGYWHKGRMQGRGYQEMEQGYVYDGEFENDVANGLGVLRDQNGFVLRGHFSFGVPQGPTRVCFHSQDSFAGTFDRGRLGQDPAVVRYPDGRLALRLTRAGVSHLIPVARQADAVHSQVVLEIEQALTMENWSALLKYRDKLEQRPQQGQPGLYASAWFLMSWRPQVDWFKALQGLMLLPECAPQTHHPSRHRDLLRGLLHLAGPARPYRTVGSVEAVTLHEPRQGYQDHLTFVAHTVLPYYGSSSVLLGDSSQMGAAEVLFPYFFDEEPLFDERFSTCVRRVCDALTEAYSVDRARSDNAFTASRHLLTHVLDESGQMDARLLGLRYGLEKAGLAPLPMGTAQRKSERGAVVPRFMPPPAVVPRVSRGTRSQPSPSRTARSGNDKRHLQQKINGADEFFILPNTTYKPLSSSSPQ